LTDSAGVIGLSTALRIQHHLQESSTFKKKDQPCILIVAEEFPGSKSINYTSSWAGAHYRPIPGTTSELQTGARWARYAYSVFEQIARDEPAAGVDFMEGIDQFVYQPPKEYLDDIRECVDKQKSSHLPRDDVSDKDHINAYEHLLTSLRQLSTDELPSGVQYAISYRSFCVNPPVYCAHLLRRFVIQGGRTRQYRLANLQEAFHLEDKVKLVVNCSGMGFADPKSYIIRGKSYTFLSSS
jgi:D-amino-acid oxidase